MVEEELKVKKTKTKVPKEAPKQYDVFYNIGTDPQFFIAGGDDYQLTTIDIRSVATGEVHSYPVILVIDAVKDTADFIPWGSVGNLRYNWGFKEEATKFSTELTALKEKLKAQENATDPMDGVSSKKKILEHDRTYA